MSDGYSINKPKNRPQGGENEAPPPRRLHCCDLDIRIGRDGTWYYKNTPINRKEMVCLFSSLLTRAPNGEYWMATPEEIGRIEVDDAPFSAVEMFVCGAGRDQVVSFRTNCDELVEVDGDHPLRVVHDDETGEASPYVMVRDGLEARLTRSVYYELVARSLEEKVRGETLLGIWSRNIFFPLGRLDEDEP